MRRQPLNPERAELQKERNTPQAKQSDVAEVTDAMPGHRVKYQVLVIATLPISVTLHLSIEVERERERER